MSTIQNFKSDNIFTIRLDEPRGDTTTLDAVLEFCNEPKGGE